MFALGSLIAMAQSQQATNTKNKIPVGQQVASAPGDSQQDAAPGARPPPPPIPQGLSSAPGQSGLSAPPLWGAPPVVFAHGVAEADPGVAPGVAEAAPGAEDEQVVFGTQQAAWGRGCRGGCRLGQ